MTNCDFYSPFSLEDLAKVLKIKKNRNDLFLIAGGTDFTIFRKKQSLMEFSVIDLSKVQEMKEIIVKEDSIEVGAGVTMTQLEKSSVLKMHGRALTDAASQMGSTQIRNRATLGGNISNAAQCADTVTASSVLHAKLILMNADGFLREVPLESFILGIGQTILQPDEALVRIRYPLNKVTTFSGFSKVGSRKRMTISKLNLAMKIEFEDQLVTKAIICAGSIGTKTIFAETMSKCCQGRVWDLTLHNELLDLGTQLVDNAIPDRESRHYKRVAIKGLISEVFQEISEQRMGF